MVSGFAEVGFEIDATNCKQSRLYSTMKEGL